MKTLILLILLLTSFSNSYAEVFTLNNDKTFNTAKELHNYIDELKKLETETRILSVTWDLKFAYTAHWISVKPDHGFFCVCPDCR